MIEKVVHTLKNPDHEKIISPLFRSTRKILSSLKEWKRQRQVLKKCPTLQWMHFLSLSPSLPTTLFAGFWSLLHFRCEMGYLYIFFSLLHFITRPFFIPFIFCAHKWGVAQRWFHTDCIRRRVTAEVRERVEMKSAEW